MRASQAEITAYIPYRMNGSVQTTVEAGSIRLR